MTLWIGSGMGPPKTFQADNGGEFANEIFRDMCENRICERTEYVKETMLLLTTV